MNRNDIIRMAREVGMQGMVTDVVTTIEELQRFAALVAAAEREACAVVSLRPPEPTIFFSENISHAQFMEQFEEKDQA
jgi:hypothetical protein